MPRPGLAAAILLLLAAGARCPGAGSPLVPCDPAAGPGAVTLMIHGETARPFSLMDLKGVTERLLTRVNSRIVTRGSREVLPEDIAAADYVVLMGIGPWPAEGTLPPIDPAKPVLVCGMPPRGSAGWPGSQKLPPKVESWPAANVSIGGASFRSDVSYFIPGGPAGSDQVLAGITAGGRKSPLAWRSGNRFWFASLPSEPATGFVFSAILPAFYGSADPGASGVLLTLEAFHTGCDPASLRRAADWLASKNHPFAVSVRVPSGDTDPAKTREFYSALQYAQSRRGRIFLIADAGALWDAALDRPPSAPVVEAGVKELERDVRTCLDNGLLPLGVRLADSGLSAEAAARLADVFTLSLGASQASDATAFATFSPGTITRVAGRLVVLPASPWFQAGQPAGDGQARNLLLLPGTVLGISVPAWLPFAKAAALLEAADGLNRPFLDAADAAASVSTGLGALWTARSGPMKPPFSGRAQLKSFDATAQPISTSEVEAVTLEPVAGVAGAAVTTLIPCAP